MWEEGIITWFTPQTRWGVCVGHASMLVECVSLTLAFHVFVPLHNVDHDCSKVFMRNLMWFSGCIVRCIWLVSYGYMSLTCWLYAAWLHVFMLGAFLNALITCIRLIGWLQELITYAWLHVFIHMYRWLGISYACWYFHVPMCAME